MAKRFFWTAPARIIGDSRPTALDIRCLAAIAFHDGMSKVKGNGGGCYAKHATLAELVGTDVSNFSKCLSRLIAWGYVAREPQLIDKRRFTLRVVYDEQDSWRAGQQSAGGIVGEPDNYPVQKLGEFANNMPEIVGEAEVENGRISRQNGGHYISLNEEIDFDESREINSPKGRDSDFSERDGAEALAIQWALTRHLPSNFTSLSPVAQLQRFEEAFDRIGRDPDRLDSRERSAFAELLWQISEDFAGENDAISQQAQRLHEEVVLW